MSGDALIGFDNEAEGLFVTEQLRSQCLSGMLPASEKLPSVRELARQLAVNVNTIFRIYERLAAEGLIELRQGDGTYVAPPRKPDGQLAAQREKFQKEFDALVQQGTMLGFSASDLRARLSSALKTAMKSHV